ncbi:Amino acid transporter, transmembrane domain containing protein [Trema orientale]|uniref:Amino acid transporter, transmembrane domain containing protein n=1 Tax=Trema orientale TaxID=63057 RepID=A0A2P5ECG7_TREOI|nr:Amino acid transporter, transmembrane domain containing protein [Trema orientale]
MPPTIETHAPLLTAHAPPAVDPASVSGAVFNVATSIVGAGIMSIPATLKVLGIIPALGLILIVGLLVDVSVEFLMRFTQSGEAITYAGVMYESFGRVGSVSTQACVMVTNLGSLIIYLIIIGDVLSGSQNGETVHLGVLQEWFGVHWWNSREFALLVTVIVVMLPLVLLKRVESLKFSSAISILLAVVFVSICTVKAIIALIQGKAKNTRLVPQLDEQTSFFDLFTAVPVIVGAFNFHYNVHPIGFELRKPSDMISAVRIALVIGTVIYITIGLFGYLLFGDSIMPDLLVNFDRSSDTAAGAVLNVVIRLSYAIHLMLVFPLLNYPLRANIDEFLFPGKPLLASDTKRFLALTLVLLVLTYLAAIAFPNIWILFQFLGSTTAVCLAFIFPSAIALRDVNGISTRRDKIMATIMMVLAVVTSIMAISTDIYNLLVGNE